MGTLKRTLRSQFIAFLNLSSITAFKNKEVFASVANTLQQKLLKVSVLVEVVDISYAAEMVALFERLLGGFVGGPC